MAIKKQPTKKAAKPAPKPKAKVKKKKVIPKAKLIPDEELPEDQITEDEKQLRAEEKKRADWEFNNEAISAAFLDMCLTSKKFPTYAAIAKRCNISERTVRRHFEKASILGDQTQKLQVLRDRSLLTIAVKAIKGDNVHWNRLFHEIIDGGGKLGRAIEVHNTVTNPSPGSAGKVETEVTLQIS